MLSFFQNLHLSTKAFHCNRLANNSARANGRESSVLWGSRRSACVRGVRGEGLAQSSLYLHPIPFSRSLAGAYLWRRKQVNQAKSRENPLLILFLSLFRALDCTLSSCLWSYGREYGSSLAASSPTRLVKEYLSLQPWGVRGGLTTGNWNNRDCFSCPSRDGRSHFIPKSERFLLSLPDIPTCSHPCPPSCQVLVHDIWLIDLRPPSPCAELSLPSKAGTSLREYSWKSISSREEGQ